DASEHGRCGGTPADVVPTGDRLRLAGVDHPRGPPVADLCAQPVELLAADLTRRARAGSGVHGQSMAPHRRLAHEYGAPSPFALLGTGGEASEQAELRDEEERTEADEEDQTGIGEDADADGEPALGADDREVQPGEDRGGEE